MQYVHSGPPQPNKNEGFGSDPGALRTSGGHTENTPETQNVIAGWAKNVVLGFRPMVQPLTCRLCSQAIAPSDRVTLDFDRLVHIVCIQRRGQDVRDRARELQKEAGQLRADADVLARQAEVSLDEARRLVRDKIATGTLPGADGKLPWITGVTGDGSLCEACGQAIDSPTMMVILTRSVGAVRMHGQCFEVWTDQTHQQP